MFTGIIQKLGRIADRRLSGASGKLIIEMDDPYANPEGGESIAVNGTCLTLESWSGKQFVFHVMEETFRRTNLGDLPKGGVVNLERAMAANGRFGGHIVSGHIDGTGIIREIRDDDNAVWYTVEAPPEILRYVVEKGSIAIDGISLTVARVDDRSFQVSVIPHTRAVTALSSRRVGSPVNLENDIVGKYVEKLMQPAPSESGPASGITMEFLAQHGY